MNCNALGQDSSKLAVRVAARVVTAIDDAIVHLRDVNVATMGSTCGANAIIAGIGNGAGIAVANLPCVAAARKELVANRGIFELLHFKP